MQERMWSPRGAIRAKLREIPFIRNLIIQCPRGGPIALDEDDQEQTPGSILGAVLSF